MGEIKKQSIQSTLILGVGVLLGFVLKLYVFPAFLNPSEIGLFTVLIDFSNIVASIIPLGSQLIFIRYLPKYDQNSTQAQSLKKLALQLSLAGLAVFVLLFFLFKVDLVRFYQEKSELLAQYFLVVLPLVVFRVLNSVSTAYSKGQKKTVFPVFVQDVLVRAMTLIVVSLYGYHILDLNGLVAAYLGLYALSAMMVWVSIKKLAGWQVNLKAQGFEKAELREILVFGGYSILTNAGALMVRSIDSIMLASLKDLEAAGIYSIAFFIGVLVEIPRRALAGITYPFLSEAFAKEQMDSIKSIYQKSALNQFITGGILFTLIVTGLDDLFKIIPNGEIYQTASMVVLIIGSAKLIDLSSGGNSELLANSPYYKYNFLSFAILAPLGILTNLFFIPKLGFVGAAWASLLSMFLVNAFRFIIIYWKYKIVPYSVNWFKFLVVLIAAFGIMQLFNEFDNPYIGILVKCSLIGIFMIAAVFILNISPDLTSIILKRKK